MGSTPSSQPVLKTKAIQRGAKNIQDEVEGTQEEIESTQGEAESIRSLYSPIMGSTPSSQPVTRTQVIQDMNETSQLSLLPEDVLIRILKLLDMKTLVLSTFRVCKSLYQLCGRYPGVQHPFLGYMGHIYERLMFSKEVPISQLNPGDNFQLQYFRPNVNLSLEGIKQPAEMRLHVFTISDSKEIRLDEIVSMVVELPDDSQADVHTEALKFLEKLVKNPLGRLKNLKLSGFVLYDSFFASLSKFSLDWLHLIHPVFDYSPSHTPFELTSAQGLKNFI